MLAEILYRIRRSLPDVGRLLGSWRLSVVLMVVAALYQGLLGVFSALSAPPIVQRISQLLPFWLVWMLLLVNTGVCLWRRFPALRRDLRSEPAMLKTPPTRALPASSEWSPERAEEEMRSLGFRITKRSGEGVWGVRHRWAPLGTYLFHGAFFLLAVAVALTMTLRQEYRIWVAEGETFSGDPAQVLSASRAPLMDPRIPAVGFAVISITPEFWEGMLLFTRLESVLGLPNGRRALTRINRPLWVGLSSFLRLSGFGYAIRYEISDRGGIVLDSMFAKLNVFPPGQRDYFTPELFPHRIEIEVIPDVVLQDGEPATKSLNLVNPAVIARVTRGKALLAEGLIRQGEQLEFEGLRLTFPEFRYWGEFSIVRDPGLPVLWLAFLVALIGLTLKVRGSRAEALWTPGTESEPGRVEYWGPEAHIPQSANLQVEGS